MRKRLVDVDGGMLFVDVENDPAQAKAEKDWARFAESSIALFFLGCGIGVGYVLTTGLFLG